MILNPNPLFGRNKPPYRVEDVFRIVTATGSNLQAAIDALSFSPDLIISKNYAAAGDWIWRDTVRGLTGSLSSISSSKDEAASSFAGYSGSSMHVAYLFKRKRDFLDILTFEGTGVAQSVAHALGSIPGMMILKNIDAASYWLSTQRTSPLIGSAPGFFLINNYTANQLAGSSSYFPTYPTASSFAVGNDAPNFNPAGNTMEAFLFGHVEQAYSVIKCGKLTTASPTTLSGQIAHGWPEGVQFLMIRSIGGPNSKPWVLDRARSPGWSGAQSLSLGHTSQEGGGATVTSDTGGVLSVSNLSEASLTTDHEYLIIRNAA